MENKVKKSRALHWCSTTGLFLPLYLHFPWVMEGSILLWSLREKSNACTVPLYSASYLWETSFLLFAFIFLSFTGTSPQQEGVEHSLMVRFCWDWWGAQLLAQTLCMMFQSWPQAITKAVPGRLHGGELPSPHETFFSIFSSFPLLACSLLSLSGPWVDKMFLAAWQWKDPPICCWST